MRRGLILLAIAFLLFSVPASVRAQTVVIDPRVLDDTANGKVGRFLVVLRSQTQTRALVASTLERAARGRLVFEALRRNADVTQSNVRAQLESLGVKYRAYYIVNAFAVEGDRAVVDALATRAEVLSIESDRPFQVNLEQTSMRAPSAPAVIEWNISKINAPSVWSLAYTGQGIVFGNADTGIQWEHPALKPNYRGWDGATADHNYSWWDAIHFDLNGNGSNPCGFDLAAPCDDWGHGTHTLGTGVGDDGAGNQIGVAPGAKWIACRNMEQGWGSPSTYLECFQFFLAPTDLTGNNPDPSKKPDVVGNSYVCPPSEGCAANSLLTAMDNLRAAGIFMAVSAGNSGATCSSISDPPAIYDSAITVGATDAGDFIAGFSSRGPVTVDGSNRRKPDLVAPGVSVRSSYPANSYATLSGTSMASPHVAGAVALLWSGAPAFRNNVDQTEAALAQTAVRLTTTQGCGGDSSTQGPNNVYGYGRIDVLAAYYFLVPPVQPFSYFFPVVGRSP